VKSRNEMVEENTGKIFHYESRPETKKLGKRTQGGEKVLFLKLIRSGGKGSRGEGEGTKTVGGGGKTKEVGPGHRKK